MEGCFKGDFSGFQGYLKEVQSNFREISKEFQGSLKGVLRNFLGCFKEVSRVFQGRLKGVSMKFLVGFKAIWKKFKVISGKSQKNFNEV